MTMHAKTMRDEFRHLLLAASVFAALSALIGTSHAAALAPGRDVAPGVAGFPRLEDNDPVAQKVNTTLQRAEDRLRHAIGQCASGAGHAGKPADVWERHVRVTDRGPGFLSLVADDSASCGGAHPDSGTLALVFDLRNGMLVNWERMLPPGLGAASLDDALDGGKVGLFNSDALARSYRAHYPARPQNGISAEDWSSCREAIADTRSFTLWTDARAHGLALAPADLPHVVAACGVPVVLDATALHQLGVSDALIATLRGEH
jgi:hypothetical protein